MTNRPRSYQTIFADLKRRMERLELVLERGRLPRARDGNIWRKQRLY